MMASSTTVPDGKHQCEERQQVDREAGHRKEGERTDQCHEDRDRRHEGRADILQEDVDHEDHEQDGFEERLDHLLHRGVEEVVHTLQVGDGDPFREFGLHLVETGR